jgi:hypothetical protein
VRTMADDVGLAGSVVVSADGIVLGTIRQIGSEYFSVDPTDPNARRYWLPLSRLASPVSLGRVTVDFDVDELDEKKAGSEGE